MIYMSLSKRVHFLPQKSTLFAPDMYSLGALHVLSIYSARVACVEDFPHEREKFLLQNREKGWEIPQRVLNFAL